MKAGKYIPVGAALAALLLLSACSSPAPARKSDVELSRVALSARRTFEVGQAEGAARLYRKALQLARASDNSPEISANAYNLALCLVSLERYSEALPLLDEAEAEAARRGADATEIRLLKAKALYLGGGPAKAAEIARTALQPENRLGPAVRAQFEILLARIALDGGDAAGAKAGLKRAEDALGGDSSTLLDAETAGLAGAILSAEGSFGPAARDFDREADRLRKSEKYREMADALRRAGEAYIKSGDNRAAADRFFRSARAAYAQGETVRSLRTIEAALASLDQDADAAELGRISALFEEIKTAVPPVSE